MKSSSPEVAVYPNAPNGAMLPAATRSVTVTRTKPLWLAVTVDVKGNTMNQGGDGTLQILNVSGSPAPIPAPTDLVDSKLVDFSRVDFPDMAWISPKTYVGVQKIGELPCLVFKNADPAGEMTAWVDLESRFPVLWRQGNQTRAFRLLSAPPQPLDFPPQLDKLFKAMKKDREILRRPIPRGG